MENKPETPEVLYQYRPPELRARDNLYLGMLFFGAPANFNDPYDCNIPPRLRNLTDEQFKSILVALEQRRNLHLDNRYKKDAKGFMEFWNARMSKIWSQERNSFGIACFSERPDNLLMWSHYSGYGKGFCLAFNTREVPVFYDDRLIRKVKYSDKYPSISDAGALFQEEHKISLMLDFLAHKSKYWQYEQEWRAFILIQDKNNKGQVISYPPEAIKAVYLGTEAEEKTKVQIRSIVEKKYPHAELWQGRLSDTEYKVEFDQIR